MKKLLFIGLMIGASSVAEANTPLAIQYGNPAPKDKAVITMMCAEKTGGFNLVN